MLLVKNKLKRFKKTIDDDDMLNYLKYSHIEHKPINNTKDVNDKTTHFPDASESLARLRDTMNKSTQTINTADKEVDTGNDFDEVIPPYVSLMHWEDFDRNEKMVQVWTKMFKDNLTPSPPSSSSSSSSSSSEGFPSKTTRMGFRLAEFALNTVITGANLTTAVTNALVDLTSVPHQSSEEEEAGNNPEVVSVGSSPPETINSSSSDVEQVPIVISSSSSSRQTPSSSRQTPSSLPAPTSPQPSSPTSSSAKTTPRKKSKSY